MRTNNINDFEFIKKKFDSENIAAPKELNTENIKALLSDETAPAKPKIKFTHTDTFKCIMAVAACAVIAVSAVAADTVLNRRQNDPITYSDAQTNTFKSYDDLKETVKEIQDKRDTGNIVIYDELENAAEAPKGNLNNIGANPNAGTTGTANDGVNYVTQPDTTAEEINSHENTYAQVEGVDEGDIIKNDGKYIYVADFDECKVLMYETDGPDISEVSSIALTETKNVSCICDMYLHGDKLAVICESIDNDFNALTVTIQYDITDRANPQFIQADTQEGSYISSRVINDLLYVISDRYIDDYKNSIPVVYSCGDDLVENGTEIAIENIYKVKDPTELDYAIISAINLDSNERVQNTTAILGASENIYCSQNNLYIMNYQYDKDSTQIMKFTLNGTEVNFAADTLVKGTVNNQYSLDEKDGNLRVATTYYENINYETEAEEDVLYGDINETNALFIFDPDLNQIGEVTGFANNESIKAVRYIGNMAYVITYEETDPLFVIDLSNPTAPEIKGSVKITGFSSMLHPVDENTLLGVGYATSQNEYGETINGIKLALFDISNSSEPKVIDTMTFKDFDSQAQYNPKAFMVNSDKGYYAIPMEYFEMNKGKYYSCAKTFTIDNGEIVLTNTFNVTDDENFVAERCTYIGDYVYIIEHDYDNGYKIESYLYE